MKGLYNQVALFYRVGRQYRIGGINGAAYQVLIVSTLIGSTVYATRVLLGHPNLPALLTLATLGLFESFWGFFHNDDIMDYALAIMEACEQYRAQRRRAACRS